MCWFVISKGIQWEDDEDPRIVVFSRNPEWTRRQSRSLPQDPYVEAWLQRWE